MWISNVVSFCLVHSTKIHVGFTRVSSSSVHHQLIQIRDKIYHYTNNTVCSCHIAQIGITISSRSELNCCHVSVVKSAALFQFSDPNNPRFQVPVNVPSPPTRPNTTVFRVNFQTSPVFAIKVSRASTGAVL